MSKQGPGLAVIHQLPKKTLQKLNLGDLKSIAGAVLVRDRIEQYFDACYRHEAALRKFKSENGYCGGRPYCMTFTKDGSPCDACAKERARMARGDTRRTKHSEYGLLQIKKRREKAAERAGKT
jgi:hypothetical protein